MTSYADFCERFHEHFTLDSNRRLHLGVDQQLGELPDPSESGCKRRVQDARDLLQTLPDANSGFDFDERLDLSLAQLLIEGELHNDTYSWAGGTRAEHTPSAGEDIGSGIFLLITNDPRDPVERLHDVTSRIEAVPDYLSEHLARLREPVARWVAMDEAKVRGLSSLFETAMSLATHVGYADERRLGRAIETALSSLADYLARLSELPTTRELHVGEATAARIVELRGIELSPAELHHIAHEFMTNINAEIDELRLRLNAKYGFEPDTSAAALQHQLNQRFRVISPGEDLDRVLDAYQLELEKVTEFVEKSQLFPLFSEQEIRIVRTPAFMRPTIPAGAMLPPAPFRKGPPTSLIYLTLDDDLLDEHTLLSIPSMIIHEAIPGHHLQLATAAQHPSLVRKHFDAMDQAEGWTTMLEDYLLDLGYMGKLTDEARFITKRELCRIGARVGIDLFFMTGDKTYLELGVVADLSSPDPFVAAADLLAQVTGFTPSRVQAELNWYSQERGYPLSYLAGNHLVWQLKRDLERCRATLPDGKTLDRHFHDVYLNAGNMPLSALRRVYQASGLIS